MFHDSSDEQRCGRMSAMQAAMFGSVAVMRRGDAIGMSRAMLAARQLATPANPSQYI
jgi:hypothetical protein